MRYIIAILLLISFSCGFSQSLPTYVPSNGLVAWYPFNGNANDESGNGNNGTVSGAILSADRNIQANKCYDFNFSGMSWNSGLHQVINIPYSSQFNSSALSVSIWFYARSYHFYSIPTTDKISALIRRFQFGYSNPNGQAWGIDLLANQVRSFVLAASSQNNQASLNLSYPVELNKWYHVVFTFDNISFKLYLNGELVSQTQSTILLNTQGNSGISIGSSNQANGYWYESDSKIDDVAIYNRSLSVSEIQQLYSQQSPCITTSNFFAQDTVKACGNSYTLDAGNPGSTYSWSTGATTQSISVNTTGWYRCTVTGNGCSVTDSVFVSLVSANIINNDTTICAFSSIQLAISEGCIQSGNNSPQWELLIPSTSYSGSEINFLPSGFNPQTRIWYSVLKNGGINRVYAFNFANNTVTALSSINAPSELYSHAYDRNNNRLVASRVGRDVVYSLPVSGGSWQQIGSGGFDSESYNSIPFWNPFSSRFSFFGGYGGFSTKNWIWENNGSQWLNTYPNNNNCNPAKRVFEGYALNGNGSKVYITSGQGNCDGNQFASSCSLGSPWATDVGIYCWLRDLWELDLNTLQFTNILPVNNQSINRHSTFAFDYTKNTFYNIGGFIPSGVYNVSSPYTMDVTKFKRGVDQGFSAITVGGTPPPADRNGVAIYDSIGNRIIYARNDGIWALNLGGSCNLTYLWSTGATTPSITVSPTQTTTYYVTVSNGISSCVDSVTISVIPRPDAGVISGVDTVCSGNITSYTSNGEAGGIWQSSNTSVASIDNNTGNLNALASGNTQISYIKSSPSCGSDTAVKNIAVKTCLTLVNLKAFIQGFYASPGFMRPALFYSGINGTNLFQTDTITVEIRDDQNGSLIGGPVNTIIQYDGTASVSFPQITGNHYIVIKHRNALETWSANPVAMGTNVSYDFTNAANKAYGNNMVGVTGGRFAIWSGDVNQDGVIESSDYAEIENDILSILFGYHATDISGDGVVESADYALMENNILRVIFVQRPF